MDEHDQFLIVGTTFIVALLVGMALGNLWSSFVSGFKMSVLFM